MSRQRAHHSTTLSSMRSRVMASVESSRTCTSMRSRGHWISQHASITCWHTCGSGGEAAEGRRSVNNLHHESRAGAGRLAPVRFMQWACVLERNSRAPPVR